MRASIDKIDSEEKNALAAIADDALKTFRAGLFMIVIYISIISLTLQTGGSEYVQNIFNSSYTIVGIIFWIGSLTVSVFTHRFARRVTLKDHYPQLGRIDDKFDVLNLSTTSTFGLLVAVFSLIMGLLAGLSNTISDTSGSIGVGQPLSIIAISVAVVAVIYSTLSVLDMIRGRWGPIREILRLSESDDF
jgi:succinate dehydrogenase hydrophobic anchor subunit